MENEDRTNVERENLEFRITEGVFIHPTIKDSNGEPHQFRIKRFDRPVVARFDSVLYVEDFQDKGYVNREGFYRGEGDLPNMSLTREDNATCSYQTEFFRKYGEGKTLGEGGLEFIEKLFSSQRAYEFEAENFIESKFKGKIEDILDIELEDFNGVNRNQFWEKFSESKAYQVFHESKEYERAKKRCEDILKNDPELRIYLAKENASQRMLMGNGCYAIYDVCAIMDASKCKFNSRYQSVSDASYFGCKPDALMGYSVEHKKGYLRDTVVEILENTLGEGVPIYDRGLNQISSGKGRFKDEKMKGGNE